ncbi:hypothetical protein ACFLUG_03685 [Chloroflexota bacterium]
MAENEWECPVCNTNTNTQGNVFSGCRAVSLHIAGKIRGGSNAHKHWAYEHIGDLLDGTYVKSSINNLSEALEVYVYRENQERITVEEERRQELLNSTVIEEAPEDITYKHWRLIETSLHRCVLDTLKENYGENEEGWWVQGVPSQTRAECAQRRELSPARGDLFSYVFLLDLRKILDKNWGLFQPHFNKIKISIDSKGKFISSIEKLNDIRNRIIAHPIHEPVESEEVEFVVEFWDTIKTFTNLE